MLGVADVSDLLTGKGLGASRKALLVVFDESQLAGCDEFKLILCLPSTTGGWWEEVVVVEVLVLVFVKR